MRTLISADELTDFRRCRRAWDLGAPSRRNLEPITAADGQDVADAIRQALAVYYFPGMWDWDRSMVTGLVREGLRRSLAAGSAELALAETILSRYFSWAPAVDRFAPIRVMSDYELRVPDPRAPERALLDPAGNPVDFGGRIDLLAADAADRYWLVRHRVGRGDWANEQLLRLDDREVADCWGWQGFQPGLALAGTVTNELRLDLVEELMPIPPPSEWVPRVAQHAPSGGGRSIPHHQRVQVAAAEAEDRITVDGAGAFRRTWIPRSPGEIESVGARIGEIALDMLDPALRVYPTPSPAQCPECPFQAPCMAMSEGQSVEQVLNGSYRERRHPTVEPGRLGGVTWGMGRGAAPPPWGRPES